MIKAEDQILQATDLRIGNWFKYSKNNDETTVFTITYDRHDGYLINDMPEYAIRGIELNEEWLIKLGFEHSGDYYVKDQVYIMIKSYLEPRLYHYKFNYASIDIPYVHQAQNLYFALTGTELTIKP